MSSLARQWDGEVGKAGLLAGSMSSEGLVFEGVLLVISHKGRVPSLQGAGLSKASALFFPDGYTTCGTKSRLSVWLAVTRWTSSSPLAWKLV